MSVTDIEDYFSSGKSSLSSILRRKQHRLDIEEKRKEVLELMVKGESQELINEKIEVMEAEESIYERLVRAFPGYFGQMIFMAYQPFLSEPLDKGGKEAYEKFVEYLDNIPSFDLDAVDRKSVV